MSRTFLVLSTFMVMTASLASGEDFFLTIGGGYSPHGNQVSLEKNVFFFEKVLSESKVGSFQHDILFSDGNDNGRDLQYYDPQQPVPEVHRLLAEVFQNSKHLQYRYRSHEVKNLYGGSNREDIGRWFDRIGSTLTEEDRLLIYVTAHGGKGDKKDARNTGLYLWNRQRVNMKDFVGWLDKVPTEVPVAIVMVQCYSGGFADIIFEGGDRAKGLAKHNRCGFFATVHDRPAAGCTPDITEENYHEYSSYFWAAVRGRTRTGDLVPSADYDQNGTITFDEAHGYALIQSPTIDISVKTSDAFLRSISQTLKGKDALTASSSYEHLLSHASATDRTVLDALADQLGLAGDNRQKAASDKINATSKLKKSYESKRKSKKSELSGICRQIADSLKQQWPEFSNPWHPGIGEILQQESSEVVKAIRTHGRYQRLETLRGEIDKLSEQIMDCERIYVKCRRVQHVLENIALHANLTRFADGQTKTQYDRLRLAESRALGPAAPGETVSATVATAQ